MDYRAICTGHTCIGVAASLVRILTRLVAAAPLHYERRKAVGSSFRGLPPPFNRTVHSVRTFGNRYNRVQQPNRWTQSQSAPWTYRLVVSRAPPLLLSGPAQQQPDEPAHCLRTRQRALGRAAHPLPPEDDGFAQSAVQPTRSRRSTHNSP
jgi:hypothetical protein